MARAILFLSLLFVCQAYAQLSPICGDMQAIHLQDLHLEYERQFPTIARKRFQFAGLQLEATIEEQRILQEMSREGMPSGYLPATCRKVICALTHLMKSEESALRAMLLAKREGFYLSLVAGQTPMEAQKMWSLDEVRIIDHQLRILPREFKEKAKKVFHLFQRASWAVRTLKPLEFDYRVQAFARPKSDLPGVIKFYDPAMANMPQSFRITILHEMAHHFDNPENRRTGQAFRLLSRFENLTQWSLMERKRIEVDSGRVYADEYQYGPGSEFVSSYAATQPGEDFAESVAYYVEEPVRMRALAPKKYAHIKEHVFQGQEFISSRIPELASIDSRVLQPQALALSCLQSFQQIQFKYPEKAVSFVQGQKLSSDIDPSCLQPLMNQLIGQDISLCIAGEDLIASELWRHLNYPMQRLSENLRELAKNDFYISDYNCRRAGIKDLSCRIGSVNLISLPEVSLNYLQIQELLFPIFSFK